MWNLKINDRNELTYKTERDSKRMKSLMVVWRVGKEWRKLIGSLDGHVHTAIFKMDNQQGPSV